MSHPSPLFQSQLPPGRLLKQISDTDCSIVSALSAKMKMEDCKASFNLYQLTLGQLQSQKTVSFPLCLQFYCWSLILIQVTASWRKISCRKLWKLVPSKRPPLPPGELEMLTGWKVFAHSWEKGANEECDENFHWESVAIEQLCLRVSVNKVCSRHNFYSGGDKMTAYLGEEEGGWVKGQLMAAGISRVQPSMLATQTLFPVLTPTHLGKL